MRQRQGGINGLFGDVVTNLLESSVALCDVRKGLSAELRVLTPKASYFSGYLNCRLTCCHCNFFFFFFLRILDCENESDVVLCAGCSVSKMHRLNEEMHPFGPHGG